MSLSLIVDVDDEVAFNAKVVTPSGRKSLGTINPNITPPQGITTPTVSTVQKDTPSGIQKCATSLSWGLVGSPYPPAKNLDQGISPYNKSKASSILSPTPVKRAVESANSILNEIASVFSPVSKSGSFNSAPSTLEALMPEVGQVTLTMESLEALDIDSIISLEPNSIRLSVGSCSSPLRQRRVEPLAPATTESEEVPVVEQSSFPQQNTATHTPISASITSPQRALQDAFPICSPQPMASPGPVQAPVTLYTQLDLDNLAAQLRDQHAAQVATYESKLVDFDETLAALNAASYAIRNLEGERLLNAASISAITAELTQEREAKREGLDEAGMLKAQIKALTHRLQSIDDESSQTITKAQAEIAMLTLALSDCKAAHNEAMMEHRSVLLAAAAAEKDAALAALTQSHHTELQALQEVISKQNAEIASIPAALTAAEAKGKQYVYKKVEKQFEDGNKEFIRVKKELTAATKIFVALTTAINPPAPTPAGASEYDMQSASDLAIATVTSLRSELTATTSQAALAHSAHQLERSSFESEIALKMSMKEKELADSKESSRATITMLESSLQRVEGELKTAQESLNQANLQVKHLQSELSEACQERDMQMKVTAKMMTTQTVLEKSLQESVTKAQECEVRVEQLRQMNAEVMSMLEKAYAERGMSDGN